MKRTLQLIFLIITGFVMVACEEKPTEQELNEQALIEVFFSC